MNEILAIIYLLLTLDYFNIFEYHNKKSEELSFGNQQKAQEVLDEFKEFHNLKFLRADCYEVFSQIMKLGVLKFFYKDMTAKDLDDFLSPQCNMDQKLIRRNTLKKSIDKESAFKRSSSFGTQNVLSTRFTINLKDRSQSTVYNQLKIEFNRERTMKQLKNARRDAERTELKQRCNKIINQLLIKIDPNLVEHLRKVELQPVILLVKWIRCFFAREGSILSVFCMWDYLLSNTEDEFGNLDFLCLAIIQFRRQEMFKCQAMYEGMQLLQNIPSIEDPYTFIEVSQRIQKIHRDIMDGKNVEINQAQMNLDQINMGDYHTKLPIDFKKEVKRWKMSQDRKAELKKYLNTKKLL